MSNIPKTDEAGIRQAIRALRKDGWGLDWVYDGGEYVPVSTESEAIDAITAVDDAVLQVRRHATDLGSGYESGWVRFVLGNDPDEVICDYTVNLTVLDDLIDKWIKEA